MKVIIENNTFDFDSGYFVDGDWDAVVAVVVVVVVVADVVVVVWLF